MTGFENVYVYVSDALRCDWVPESIASEGDVMPTLAPAAYTPISFSSLASGLSPENHSVRSFHDCLEADTVLDGFESACYYDHPDGAMSRNVFGSHGDPRELDSVEEPFFYVERALDTHFPYGQVPHGNEIPDDPEMSGGHVERYERGVESTERHFWSHVQNLKDRGILEDTLVIFTSDHGELLGEHRLFRERHGHNMPLTRELCVVPTVFLNYEAGYERMRTIDIAPTAAALTDREFNSDGLNLEENLPERGTTMIQVNRKPLVAPTCEWRWKDDSWQRGVSGVKTDAATLAMDVLQPVKKTVKNVSLGETASTKGTEMSEDVSGLDV